MLFVALGMIGLACGSSVASVEETGAAAAAMGGSDTVLAEFEWDGVKHEITLSQMEDEIAELPDYRRDDYDGRAGREEYLQLMAESRLGLERARDLGLDADSEILEKVETYRREMMLDAVEEIEVDAKVNVTDADIAAHYDANMEDYLVPEQVRLIAVTVQEPETAAALLAEIQAGERTLDEMAVAMTADGSNKGPGGNNDGNTGLFSRDTWTEVETFVDRAFEIEVGEMTDEVLEMDRMGELYYMIFRKEEHNDPRQQTLEEGESRVRKTVEKDTEAARQETWASQLRESAELVINEDAVPVLAPEATDEPEEGDEPVATEETPEPDAALALAAYMWDGASHTYTYGELKAHFDGLAVYRQSRFKGKDGAISLLDEQILEDLKVLEAKQFGFGHSEEDLAKLDDYRDQLMVEALVEQEVDGKIEVTEEDLQAYYDEHLDEYIEDEKTQLTCATFTDGEEAQAMLDEVVAGRDMAELAMTLSEMGANQGPGGNNNGDTGLFSRNTYRQAPNFVEQAFSIPVGEITPAPIEVNLDDATYFMIFRVEDRRPERQKDLDEEDVLRKVKRAAERISKRERFEEWLEGLVTASKLQVHTDRLPEYPEDAEGDTDADDDGDGEGHDDDGDGEGHDDDGDGEGHDDE